MVFCFPSFIAPIVALCSSTVSSFCRPEYVDPPFCPVLLDLCEVVNFLDSRCFAAVCESSIAFKICDRSNTTRVTSVGAYAKQWLHRAGWDMYVSCFASSHPDMTFVQCSEKDDSERHCKIFYNSTLKVTFGKFPFG